MNGNTVTSSVEPQVVTNTGGTAGTRARSPRPGIALLAILGLYFVLGTVYGILSPALEKPDEEWHYAYIQYLRQEGALPPITTDESLNPALQEAGQPPLFYAIAAGVTRLIGLDVPTPLPVRNPYWAYPTRGTINDNKTRFVHRPGEWWDPTLRALLILRGLSLLLGAGAVVSAYGLARAVGAPIAVALVAAVFVATLPQYLFIASSVSNDAFVTALTGGGLWALVVALRRPPDVRLWIMFGLLAGLASLTKASALLLPFLGAGLAVIAGIQRRDGRVMAWGIFAGLGGVALCTGWWYLRNTALYGDPLGLGIHFAEYGRDEMLAPANLIEQARAIETSFWAAFGWGNVTLPAWIYLGLRSMVLMALGGVVLTLLQSGRSPGNTCRLALWAVVLYVAGTGISLAVWTSAIAASLGRLLFPALVGIAVLFALGWHRLWQRLPAIMVGGLTVLAITASVYLARAYEPPARLPTAEPSPGTQPTHLIFGELARLFAVDVAPQRVKPGEEVNVTLCWEALRSTALNYSVFVQLVGEADRIVGRRGTYPGLGNFATSLWRPGDAFCDFYRVPVNGDAPGPAVYAVEVGIFDLLTGSRLPATDAAGNSLGLAAVADIKVVGPGAAMPPAAQSEGANFAGVVTLLGYEWSAGQPGEAATLTLYWRAEEPMAVDYTVFVHLLDSSGNVVAQGDAPPQAGRYPTHWWDRDELVADSHDIPLPLHLVTGDYRVRVGLYNHASGERLPRAGVSDNAVELGPFSLGR